MIVHPLQPLWYSLSSWFSRMAGCISQMDFGSYAALDRVVLCLFDTSEHLMLVVFSILQSKCLIFHLLRRYIIPASFWEGYHNLMLVVFSILQSKCLNVPFIEEIHIPRQFLRGLPQPDVGGILNLTVEVFECSIYWGDTYIVLFVLFLLSLRFGQIPPLAFFRWFTTTSDRNAESCNRIPSKDL